MLTVRDAMSHPAITVRPHLSVRAAAARLVTHGFTAAPVVTAEGVVVGIVTEADLLRGRIPAGAAAVDPTPDPPVSDVMTIGPIAVAPDDDMAAVAALLLDHGVRVVPVLDRGHLVGVVTARDVLRRVASRELVSAPRRPGTARAAGPNG
ncbi:HPP family protein [Pseudonocardia sp. GCM10023141]|uniref:CBS domain-containing protein n=1 Tax=Pseudonocardia sp. GCM10023141 TaxID=3252653 RepID=UPI00361BBF36